MTAVDLAAGALELTGRLVAASNATFLGSIGEVDVVYKPTAGERPLWDFPDHTLAAREVASYEVSQALGWNIVPRTWMRDGRFGPGMVQIWCEPAADAEAVTLVRAADGPPEAMLAVFEGLDGSGDPVLLVHEDSAALRRMAIFDVVINNADRKGGHILAMANGHRYGVDHGLTFHTEPKLRTILWGWLGEPLTDDEHEAVARLRRDLDADLGGRLAAFVTDDEVAACAARCDDLLTAGCFPAPSGDMPPIPWPPL